MDSKTTLRILKSKGGMRVLDSPPLVLLLCVFIVTPEFLSLESGPLVTCDFQCFLHV